MIPEIDKSYIVNIETWDERTQQELRKPHVFIFTGETRVKLNNNSSKTLYLMRKEYFVMWAPSEEILNLVKTEEPNEPNEPIENIEAINTIMSLEL